MLLAQGLFLTSVFGSVGTLAWLVTRRIIDNDGRKITDRLNDKGRRSREASDAEQALRKGSILKRLGAIAARPFATDPNSERVTGIRAKLAMAGIYDPAAIRTLIGFKFIAMLGGILMGYVIGGSAGSDVMGGALGGLAGYMAPQMWLRSKINANQKALNQGLPDALDLMVICVESGLTVDGTMQRVGEELVMAHPAVSREFGICYTESRLGVSRQQSFKNLASRTGNLYLQSLTAMLIQADRFGTSVALALRVQAESMRTKRQFAAEEVAAKASVKMSFPLVLFIFPATFMVMMGPMIVQFMKDGMF